MRALALLALLAVAPASAQPSFDCARAESDAERLVCDDAALADLDRELSRLYGLAAKGPHMTPDRLTELRATQRGWVKGRDDCWKASDLRTCVRDVYALRIAEIRQGYADARSADEAGVSRGPFPFVCEGADAPISVSFVGGDAPLAIVRAVEAFWVLPASPSGSGARYADGADEFWTKGAEALATLGGAERTCRLDDRG